MKRTRVVRQNRCDGEMNFLFFGTFFLYTVLQFFAEQVKGFRFAGACNLALYMIFVPGFLFLLGYRFAWNLRNLPADEAKGNTLRTAGRCYGYFLFLAIGQEMFVQKESFSYALSEVLTVVHIPSVSAVFFTMALTLLFVWVFFDGISRWMGDGGKKLIALGILCLAAAFLWTDQEMYAITAAFTGASGHHAVPGVPYFAFFLLGLWFEEKKPGFDLTLLGITAAVTAVSALLYRTPAQDLCRVTISALPVYLVYAAAEALADMTLRFKAARYVSTAVERIYLIFTAILFALLSFGALDQAGWKEILLLAAGLFMFLYVSVFLFQAVTGVYEKVSRTFEERVRHKTAVYFLFYTLAFTVLLALVFFEFIRLDKGFIWIGDGVTQYYPRALYFSRYIRDLVSNFLAGNYLLPMYDFTLGFGTEVTYSLEPLYFLYALFGEDHIEFTYNLVTLLRFYLAGITSSVLMLYFGKGYFAAFLGSVVYVFSGFSLYGGAKHTMFMIPMIMLPLLILAMEEIIRKRRWYLCTIFVAISLFSNYYYLYMNTIAMGIYFVVRFCCQEKKEDKTLIRFIQRGLVISGSYLLGVGMSCIVLATTFGLYLGSGRSGSFSIHTPSMFFYYGNRLVRTFLNFLTTAYSPGDWLKLGYLPIAMLAVAFLFLRKGRKELKIFCVITLVFLAFPAAGFVFSGFSAVINRWCYMVSLLVGYIVAECYEEMLRLRKRDLYVLGGTVAVYGFLSFFGEVTIAQSSRYTKLAFIFLALTMLVLLFSQVSYRKLTKASKQCMTLILTAALVFANGFTEFSMNDEIDLYVDNGKIEELILDTPLAALDQIEDDSFYRSAVTQLDYLTSSASLLLEFHPITMVNSTLNGSISEYMEKMGCTSYSTTQLKGLSRRTFLDSLASVKYYGRYGGQKFPVPYGYEEILKTEVNGRTAKISENQYALPLGYTYAEAVSEEELEQYAVPERQEVMMQRVVLKDGGSSKTLEQSETVAEGTEESDETDASARDTESDEVMEENGADTLVTENGIQITGEKREIISYEEKGIQFTEQGFVAGGDRKKFRLDLNFDGMENAETYLVFKNAQAVAESASYDVELTAKVKDSQTAYKFEAQNYRYASGQEDHVINLGYFEDALTSCTIWMDAAGSLTFDDFYIFCQPMDHAAEYMEALREDVLENVVLDTNRVSGSISLDQDKYLVLSIPYQNGWSAYVDGVKTELQRANYMYMALDLEAGEHTIELEFVIPAVKYALVIMAASVVLFTGLCLGTFIWTRKKRKK